MQICVGWSTLASRALAVVVGVACLAVTPGARAEESRETPESELRRSATSLTVVTREQIERRQWRTLVELLQGQPGLHVSQLGGLGQPAQLFVRGQRRGRVLVRLDGIEISDPASKDPGTVLPDLLSVDIERVEIQRGPQGVAAGNDALGGVIDIVTRRGSGPATPWARIEAGGFGTYQSSGGIRGGTESVDYAFSYTHLNSRGINVRFRDDRDGERDGYENDSVGGRLDLRPADGLRLGLRGRFVDSERDLDSGVVGLDDPTDPSPATFNVRDIEGSRSDARRLFLRGEAELALFGDRWVQEWSVGYTDHASQGRALTARPAFTITLPATPFLPIGIIGDAPTVVSRVVSFPELPPRVVLSDSDSSRLALASVHELRFIPGHQVRIGAQVDSETFRQAQVDLDANLGGLLGALVTETTSVTASHERARNLSAFVEDRFTLGDLFGDVGARVQDHDEFGSQLSYRVGLGYRVPSSQLKLFASFGTAFRDPDLPVAADTRASFLSNGSFGQPFFQQGSRPVVSFRGSGFDTTLVVADLEAERIRAAEVGMEAPFLDGRGNAGIALFTTRSRHVPTRGVISDSFQRVVFEFAQDSLETRARGVEAWLRLDVVESFGVELDYTYTRSRLGHDLGVVGGFEWDMGGDAELGIPRHRADVSLRYAPFEGIEGWLALRYVGKRHDEEIRALTVFRDPVIERQRAFEAGVIRGAYTTFDLGLSWRLRPSLTLFARVENLFDREYNDPAQTNSPGRAGYLGLQLELAP